MRRLVDSKLKLAIVLIILVFITGIIGFRFLYDYSWVDALYMTIITISTVGYGEVQPMGAYGKIFTSIFIISGLFIFGFGLSTITEHILNKNNIGNLKRNKMKKRIDSFKDHIIVCGYGQNGKEAVQKLVDYRKDFVIIDENEEVFHGIGAEKLNYIVGNATEDEVLETAGIERASTLICTLPRDADNLFIVLSARQLNKELKIISRATEENSYKKLKLAGADNVIMPDRIGGSHMASLVVVPDLVEFLDNLSVSGKHDSINVEQIPFSKVCSDGREKTIAETDIRKNTGCSIIGYKSPLGTYVVNPEPSLKLEKNSKLIMIGRPEQIDSLKRFYSV
ncbi:potassium channel family protein [Christiangramia forsetii]|uniref:MthK-like calcium-gated potassium channel n=2 Tax=Christiangramia forsetii TaxID=411153 RepID=A0M406_CHRFK|nr:potassium channel protein [Christiangramia forsetii]GGG24545.1 potassium transporter TrkA [Christiangramia forsetii]CAL67351.1 MthK-like calcium-gated potassium channel [Christiangramia forsetii KT0803]